MRIKDLDPKWPVTAQALYPDKTLAAELTSVGEMRRFIEHHESQGAHWVVFTWEDHTETVDTWSISVEKRLSIGFTQNMLQDDEAAKEETTDESGTERRVRPHVRPGQTRIHRADQE